MLRVITLLIITIIFTPPSTLASTSNAAPLGSTENPLILMGIYDNWPKFDINNSGKAIGLIPEIIEKIANNSGITIKLEAYPWMRVLNKTLNNYGGALDLSKTPEREKIYSYSDVIYREDILLVTRKDRKFKFESYDDLNELHIGIFLGAIYGPKFDELKKNGQIKTTNVSRKINKYRMLLAGRIDAVVGAPNYTSLKKQINTNNLLTQEEKDALHINKKPFLSSNVQIGFSKKFYRENPVLINKINKAIDELNKNGEIKNTHNKYTH